MKKLFRLWIAFIIAISLGMMLLASACELQLVENLEPLDTITNSHQDSVITASNPIVILDGANAITDCEALLKAAVTPNDKAVKVWFELSRADSIQWEKHNLDSTYSGRQSVRITIKIKELQPETKYLAAIKAKNSTGETIGANIEFTTLKAP